MDEVEVEPFTKEAFSSGQQIVIRSSGERRNRTLLILVHGLNGSGHSTWHQLPKFLLEDQTVGVDVGVFDYTSSIRRYRGIKTTSLDDTAALLAREVQLASYESIILAGHSMGGLIVRKTVLLLHQRENPEFSTLSKICGILYFACPLTGSTKAKWPLTLLPDVSFLKVNSPEILDLIKFFNSRVDERWDASNSPQRYTVPALAARATRDTLVHEASSIGSLPDEQITPFDETHSSLVKPRAPHASFYNWLRESIRRLIQHHSLKQASKPIPTARATIVTELAISETRHDWENAFFSAVRAISAVREDVKYVDRRDADHSLRTNLAVQVFTEQNFLSGGQDITLKNLHARQQRDAAISLGVVAYGSIASDALAIEIVKKIGPAPPSASRWVEVAGSAKTLRLQFLEWLTNLTDRQNPLSYTDKNRLAEALAVEDRRYSLSSITDFYDLGG